VKVPQLSESVSEATLVSWHKKIGEAVKRDENLIDIETDKVVLELPAPADGVLTKIVKGDGESVTSGDVIATHRHDAKATRGSARRPPRARPPPGRARRERRCAASSRLPPPRRSPRKRASTPRPSRHAAATAA
jgi:2-oxoglutarate dehydrogenase E2 component (dihydrolipoamide succinyltransferase)